MAWQKSCNTSLHFDFSVLEIFQTHVLLQKTTFFATMIFKTAQTTAPKQYWFEGPGVSQNKRYKEIKYVKRHQKLPRLLLTPNEAIFLANRLMLTKQNLSDLSNWRVDTYCMCLYWPVWSSSVGNTMQLSFGTRCHKHFRQIHKREQEWGDKLVDKHTWPCHSPPDK